MLTPLYSNLVMSKDINVKKSVTYKNSVEILKKIIIEADTRLLVTSLGFFRIITMHKGNKLGAKLISSSLHLGRQPPRSD